MLRFIIPFLFLLLFDLYVFRVIHKQVQTGRKWIKIAIYSIYWIIPAIYMATPFYFRYFMHGHDAKSELNRLFFFASFAVFYVPKLIIMAFQALEDGARILAWIAKRVSPVESKTHKKAAGISRSVFISRMGLFISAVPFTSLIYSIAIGRFNFKLNKQTLYFDRLPKAFDGYKIVQFSDLHAGSLIGQQAEFKKAMEMINEQNADIIVFTGDMVNDVAEELDDWIELLSTLKAKVGKYSIFGNHDYGNYNWWENDEKKSANVDKLKQYHEKIGFNLMLNSSEIMEKDGEKIALLGVENWGERNFQYGRLDIAQEKVKDIPFKILLSHDPSHWDNQVVEKTDIALTLSGHTHGMQMALNFGGYTWNPISHKFKRRNGLYFEGNQQLYVNTGLGYIDFPGRIGADPEITVFELRVKN